MSLLLGLLTLIFFWPQIVGGKALYWGDIGLYFTPMQDFLHQNLHAGRIPLWNPLILCGTPYVGNPQTWPLYPFTALLGGLSAGRFLNLTIVFHVWFAALGTYFFLRRALGRTASASLLGAIVFAFGGQLIAKEQFPNMLQAASFLPWMLWLTFRLVTVRQWGNALHLGLILGLQLLAAHAQMTLLTLYLGAAYGLFVLANEIRDGRRPRCAPFIGKLVVAGLVAAGLAAGQILPTAELYRDAWRQRLSFAVVDRFYLPLNQLGNWVLPSLHGHPIRGNFTARGNFWETCCFVGWTAGLLALYGLVLAFRAPKHRLGRFWAGAFIVGILLALGGQTWRGAPAINGLYWVAYHLLPGFRSFHDPARCLLWCAFATAVLAAGGLEALSRRLPRNRRSRLLPFGLAVLCFVELLHFGRTLYPLTASNAIHPTTALVASVMNSPDFRSHQARFLAPDSARVWQRFTGHRSFRQDTPDYLALWADTMTPNLMMSYDLPDAGGYEPVTRRDTQTVVGTMTQAFSADATASQRAEATTWAGALGVRDIVTLRVRPPELAWPGLKSLASTATLAPLGKSGNAAKTYLSKNERWQPRARIMTNFHSGALARYAHADIAEDTPDRVKVRTATTVPALLVLADTDSPGWQATVDGKPSDILSADLCLRAVSLPTPGTRTVVFTYRPTSYRLGLYLTLLTTGVLAGCGAGAAIGVVKKHRDRAGNSPLAGV